MINFPADFRNKKISGSVTLYCPADEKKDIEQKFSMQDETITVAIPKTHNGSFELQISWQAGGINYYYGKKIFIQ